ncbi:hypothetical protein RFI_22348, partial [Reticulomyxa filosa]
NNNNNISFNMLSEMSILCGDWLQINESKEPSIIIQYYRDSVKYQPKFEKSFFKLATYMDILWQRSLTYVYIFYTKQSQKYKHSLQENQHYIGGSDKNPIDMNCLDFKHSIEGIPWEYLIHENIISQLSELLLQYMQSLQYGHIHLFQTLPRILTLWFDYGNILNYTYLMQQNSLNKKKNLIMVIF